MIWRKNAFSCLMWAVYLFMVGTAMVFTSRAVCDSLGMAGYFRYVIPAAYLLLTGALVYGLHRMAVKLDVGAGKSGRGLAWLERFLILALFVAGIFLRVAELQREGLAEPEESVYLELAYVSSHGQGIPHSPHGAVYLYICLLRLCFILLGNKAVVAVWLQIALQLFGILLLHVVVRKMAGRIPAVIMAAFFMLSPYMVRKSLELSPEMLYLLLFSLVLSFLSQGMQFVPRWGFWLVAGAMSAVLCYLDVAGFLLLPLIFGVIVMRRQGVGREILQGISGSLAGFLLGAAGSVLAEMVGSGRPLTGIVRAWTELYRWSGLQLSIRLSGFDVMWLIVLLLCFMAWGVFGFWCGRGVERFTAWIFCLCMAVLLQFSGMFTEEMTGFCYIFLFSTILAGLGIRESTAVYPVEAKPGRRKKKETAGDPDQADDLEIIAEAGVGKTEAMEKERVDAGKAVREESIKAGRMAKGESTKTGKMVKGEDMEAGSMTEGESTETGRVTEGESTEAGKVTEGESTEAGKVTEGESTETGRMAEGESTEAGKVTEGESTETGRMAEGESTETERMVKGEGMEKETRAGEKGVQAEEQPGKERKIEFLENPLPLPKKHEKRVMDYKLDSDKDLGGYDIYVADDDDFDH